MWPRSKSWPSAPCQLPLQRWSYWREHLKYVWNVYCVVTNHRRDHHTKETTGNERFPIGHGTNYFHFVLTFSLFTSKQLLFLPICLQYALYCSDFEINYKADVPGLRKRRFGARVFKLVRVRVRENLIRENVLDLHNNGLSIRQTEK